MPEKKQSHVRVVWEGADPSDKDSWPKQHQWILDELQKMHATFSGPVKLLNADDYTAEELVE